MMPLATFDQDEGVNWIENCIGFLGLRGHFARKNFSHLFEIHPVAHDRHTIIISMPEEPVTFTELIKRRFPVVTAGKPSVHVADCVGHNT